MVIDYLSLLKHDEVDERDLLGLENNYCVVCPSGGQRSHLCHKVCGCVAECFKHGRGFGVEQRHPVGHLIVDFVLNVQL